MWVSTRLQHAFSLLLSLSLSLSGSCTECKSKVLRTITSHPNAISLVGILSFECWSSRTRTQPESRLARLRTAFRPLVGPSGDRFLLQRVRCCVWLWFIAHTGGQTGPVVSVALLLSPHHPFPFRFARAAPVCMCVYVFALCLPGGHLAKGSKCVYVCVCVSGACPPSSWVPSWVVHF